MGAIILTVEERYSQGLAVQVNFDVPAVAVRVEELSLDSGRFACCAQAYGVTLRVDYSLRRGDDVRSFPFNGRVRTGYPLERNIAGMSAIFSVSFSVIVGVAMLSITQYYVDTKGHYTVDGLFFDFGGSLNGMSSSEISNVSFLIRVFAAPGTYAAVLRIRRFVLVVYNVYQCLGVPTVDVRFVAYHCLRANVLCFAYVLVEYVWAVWNACKWFRRGVVHRFTMSFSEWDVLVTRGPRIGSGIRDLNDLPSRVTIDSVSQYCPLCGDSTGQVVDLVGCELMEVMEGDLVARGSPTTSRLGV